jgi:hypothetical protein
MAVAVKVTILAEVDGKLIDGFPIIRRVSTDEFVGLQKIERASGGGYVALPTSELAELRVLFVQADQAVTLRLDGQSDAGIPLLAGGLALLAGVDIDAGASTNALLENSSGSTANVKVMAAGT